MKKPLVVFKNGRLYTDSPIIYYSCVILSSLALGFFIAYIWIPLVQWIRAFM